MTFSSICGQMASRSFSSIVASASSSILSISGSFTLKFVLPASRIALLSTIWLRKPNPSFQSAPQP
jgi:hypothetical protein